MVTVGISGLARPSVGLRWSWVLSTKLHMCQTLLCLLYSLPPLHVPPTAPFSAGVASFILKPNGDYHSIICCEKHFLLSPPEVDLPSVFGFVVRQISLCLCRYRLPPLHLPRRGVVLVHSLSATWAKRRGSHQANTAAESCHTNVSTSSRLSQGRCQYVSPAVSKTCIVWTKQHEIPFRSGQGLPGKASIGGGRYLASSTEVTQC